MKKYLLLVVISALSSLSYANEIFKDASVEVSSKTLTHGGIFTIKVLNPEAKSIKIKESVLPLFKTRDGKSASVILAVPSWWDAGKSYELFVDSKSTGITLDLGGRVAKIDTITVEKSRLVSNDATTAQSKELSKAITGITEERFFSGEFVRPVEGRISTEYGVGRTMNGSTGGVHRGLDIAADEGVPVAATNDGFVTLSRKFILTGSTVVLNHGNGIVSVYYHLSKLIAEEGSKVKKGEVIGLVGNTGVSTGAHLHWGIWIFGVDGDPLELIKIKIE